MSGAAAGFTLGSDDSQLPETNAAADAMREAVPDARHERMLRDYAASAQKLRRLCAEQHVDCMLSNHPYCDYSYRILPTVEQARARGENPLLRGEEMVQEFLYGVYAEAMITLD